MTEHYNIIVTPVSNDVVIDYQGMYNSSLTTFFTYSGTTNQVTMNKTVNVGYLVCSWGALFEDEVEIEAPVYFYDVIEFDGNEFDSVSTGAGDNGAMVTQGYVDDGDAIVVVTKTSNYTASSEEVIIVNAVSNDVTITLPAVSGLSGRKYYVKRKDSTSHIVLIEGNASELIDGQLNVLLSQYDSYTVVCDGTEWWVI